MDRDGVHTKAEATAAVGITLNGAALDQSPPWERAP